MKALFQKHLSLILPKIENLLQEYHYEELVIHAGGLSYFFEDDMSPPYRSNHYFQYICPAKGHDHCLIIGKNSKPTLLFYQPDDYWHEVESIDPNSFWIDCFDIKIFNDKPKIKSFINDNCKKPIEHGPGFNCPENFIHNLNWIRTYKTEYEIHCIDEATQLAKKGHLSAKECFLNGGSELDILYSYLESMRMTEEELPYNAIIGLNEKSAVLHYFHRRDNVKNADSFLIDSGAQINGYACDITRTYLRAGKNDIYQSILDQMNVAQQEVCKLARPGISTLDLHRHSVQEVSKILINHKIVKDLNAEEVINTGIISDFYPHGIGHFLGLLVHDVGGYQKNKEGERNPIDPKYPTLRSVKELEVGHCLTIEPGLYFIDSLLSKRKNDTLSKHINWALVEELKVFGGIRIEDNIIITKDGYKNITRQHLPK